MFNFLWNSKTDRIKRDVIIQNFKDGGLKMVDIYSFKDSLKLTWIRRLYKSPGKWQYLFRNKFNLELLSNYGNEYISVCRRLSQNRFWKEVFEAWSKLNNTELFLKNKAESILKTPLWYNPDICIGNKPVIYNEWYLKGIHTINDLVEDIGNLRFYTFQDFLNIYQIESNFITYHGLISAAKKYLNKYKNPDTIITRPSLPIIPLHLEIFFKNKKGSKDFYLPLISKKKHVTPTGEKKWNETLNNENFEWSDIFSRPFIVTKSTKLQWFQFRVNHHILTTNSRLFKSGLVITPRCTFCNKENETIIHCLWECTEVQKFLNSFHTLLNFLSIHFLLNKVSFLFGENLEFTRVDNEIIILIKFYIYKSRCLSKALNVNGLINHLKDYHIIQKQVSLSKDVSFKNKFEDEWKKWENLISL